MFDELRARASELWERLSARLPTSLLLGLLVVIALLVAVARAEAAEPQLAVEAGSAIVRGETPSIALTLRWPDSGPGDSDFECGSFFNGESDFRGEPQRANFGFHCMLVDGFGRLELGVGPVLLQNTDSYNSSALNYTLLARFRLTPRWYLTLDQHASNGGSRSGNRGRDMSRIGFVVAF